MGRRKWGGLKRGRVGSKFKPLSSYREVRPSHPAMTCTPCLLELLPITLPLMPCPRPCPCPCPCLAICS